ncbi:MAG: VOC family protein [Pseudomonadota bacterium]
MTSPPVIALDHLVLTVANVDQTAAFYTQVLGMTVQVFHPADGSTRTALKFGDQKINLHQAGAEFEPKALTPTPGSADLCFLSKTPLDEWTVHFETHGIKIEQGPVARTGATGPIISLYVRDPDQNLIEVSVLA